MELCSSFCSHNLPHFYTSILLLLYGIFLTVNYVPVSLTFIFGRADSQLFYLPQDIVMFHKSDGFFLLFFLMFPNLIYFPSREKQSSYLKLYVYFQEQTLFNWKFSYFSKYLQLHTWCCNLQWQVIRLHVVSVHKNNVVETRVFQ